MENPEIIYVKCSCKIFNCKYSPDAIGVAIPIKIDDYEKGNYNLPKCPNCNSEMISDSDKEFGDMLRSAGIF